MLVLGLETSCDETAAAVLKDGDALLSNVINDQIGIHSKYGGIVPELAGRSHIERVHRVIEEAVEIAGVQLKDIDLIAATMGPGLIGSLLVGLNTAKGLSYGLKKPMVGVNHLEGHLLAIFLQKKIPFPFIALIVSGGHTDLYRVADFGKYKLMGRTRDDAAGESFDKVGKMLGFPYPGGPVIERRALDGNPAAVDFPRAAMRDYDFSFSGLKTAVLYYLQGEIKARPELLADDGNFANGQFVNDVAASFQEAVVDALVSKLIKAVKEYAPREVHLVGGCSANRHLREKIVARLARGKRPPVFRTPVKMSYCTDNAAMIGGAAYWLKNPPLD